jgi:hypothetical protein
MLILYLGRCQRRSRRRGPVPFSFSHSFGVIGVIHAHFEVDATLVEEQECFSSVSGEDYVHRMCLPRCLGSYLVVLALKHSSLSYDAPYLVSRRRLIPYLIKRPLIQHNCQTGEVGTITEIGRSIGSLYGAFLLASDEFGVLDPRTLHCQVGSFYGLLSS